MFESLETRRLLSTVTVVSGKLRIEGTSGNDSVAIARFGKTQAQVIDSGNAVLTFNIADIRSVSFAGLAGNDFITLGRLSYPCYLNGGDGNDSLSASDGNRHDTVLGGAGSDYLYGGPGNDSLDGGALDDTMLGNAGNDKFIVFSTVGNDDFISGGEGTDTVDGSAYDIKVRWEIGNNDPNGLNVNDTIFGDVERVIGTAFDDEIIVLSGRSISIDAGAGNDTVLTGSGNDSITGGAGTDSISTGGGNDLVNVDDNQVDTVNGGSGDDQHIADPFDVLESIQPATVSVS